MKDKLIKNEGPMWLLYLILIAAILYIGAWLNQKAFNYRMEEYKKEYEK